MVHGGRSRWARVVSIAGSLGALGLVCTAGCGSRTSVLDPDGYALGFSDITDAGGTGVTGGGSSATGGRPTTSFGGSTVVSAGGTSTTATAGTSTTAAGGTGTTAAGGKGGTGGLNTSLSIVPCQQYCPGYGTECAARLMGQDCFDACQGEINGSGAKCQGAGINALKCLTPFFSATDNNCDAAVTRALTKCGTVVNTFEKCKGVKTPTPTPMPTPTPTPSVDISTCPASGSGIGATCSAVYECPNGKYSLDCTVSPTSAFLADCTCTGPTGNRGFSELMTAGNPCFVEGRALCQ